MVCEACPPGLRRQLSCAHANAACQPCERDTYSQYPNTQTECRACRTRCRAKNQIMVKPCNATQDITCECGPGYFLRSPGELACEPHTMCQPGYGIVDPGSPTSNTMCAKCSAGTYSHHLSSTEVCRPHTDCAQLGGVKYRGNTTTNNVCNNSLLAQKGLILPAYAVTIISILAGLVIIALGCCVVYMVCKRLGKWDQLKRRILHGPRKQPANKMNTFHENTEEDKEGSIQLIISAPNIRMDMSNKSLNASSPVGPPPFTEPAEDVNLNSPSHKSLSPPAYQVDETTELFHKLSTAIYPDHKMLTELPGALCSGDLQEILFNHINSEPHVVTLAHLTMWRDRNPQLSHYDIIINSIEHHQISIA